MNVFNIVLGPVLPVGIFKWYEDFLKPGNCWHQNVLSAVMATLWVVVCALYCQMAEEGINHFLDVAG